MAFSSACWHVESISLPCRKAQAQWQLKQVDLYLPAVAAHPRRCHWHLPCCSPAWHCRSSHGWRPRESLKCCLCCTTPLHCYLRAGQICGCMYGRELSILSTVRLTASNATDRALSPLCRGIVGQLPLRHEMVSTALSTLGASVDGDTITLLSLDEEACVYQTSTQKPSSSALQCPPMPSGSAEAPLCVYNR